MSDYSDRRWCIQVWDDRRRMSTTLAKGLTESEFRLVSSTLHRYTPKHIRLIGNPYYPAEPVETSDRFEGVDW